MRIHNWMYTIPLRLRSLFLRDRMNAELDEELRDHIDRQIEDNLKRGMVPEEARLAALRQFGNPALERDKVHAKWSWSNSENVAHDLRISIRTLRRTPGFTVIAVLVTALGIGASVALFTVVRGVLLKPLPLPDSDRLLMLYEHSTPSAGGGDFPYNLVAPGIYDAWNKENTTFSDMALVRDDEVALSASGGQLPEMIDSGTATWNLFSVLGVNPALGRSFTKGDDNPAANGTVVLSWSLWKRRFGSDSAIFNRIIYLDAKPYTVIGVMPEWFEFPSSTTQLWTPAYHERSATFMSHLEFHSFRAVGRLKPGVTADEATANLSMISQRLHDSHRDIPFIAAAASSRSLLEHIVGNIKRPLYVMLAATGCLLLIACLNVANLLVARSASRRKEFAIRTALGGGRMRLLREHLMESLVLQAMGGAAGLLLAYGAITWLVHTRHGMVRVNSIQIDGVVAAFTLGVVILCALFSGLLSAFNADDKKALSSLHESSRGSSAGAPRARLRKILLAVEVALTVVLLIVASLLLKSYQRLRTTNMGCTTDNVLTMRINLPGARYKTPGLAPATFFESLLVRVRSLPGVKAASFVNAVPGEGYWGDLGFSIAEHPPMSQGRGSFAINRSADPDYFTTLGIPIWRGRTFGPDQKLERANEVIIDESFAKEFFPGEDPIGKHIRSGQKQNLHQIVGIVGDTRYAIGEAPQPMQYYPFFAGDLNGGTLAIRADHDVEQLALPVQQIIQRMDRDLPVSKVLTMNQLLGKSTLDQSFDAALITGFAVLSLLLAAAGLFGVLSYIGAQRSGELGIRIALGAQRSQVLALVLVDGLNPAIIGLLLGLAASAGATRFVKAMLHETQPLDPVLFAMVAAVLIATAALACIGPAWRASRLDPMRVLRME